jgi:hypothetical protein
MKMETVVSRLVRTPAESLQAQADLLAELQGLFFGIRASEHGWHHSQEHAGNCVNAARAITHVLYDHAVALMDAAGASHDVSRAAVMRAAMGLLLAFCSQPSVHQWLQIMPDASNVAELLQRLPCKLPEYEALAAAAHTLAEVAAGHAPPASSPLTDKVDDQKCKQQHLASSDVSALQCGEMGPDDLQQLYQDNHLEATFGIQPSDVNLTSPGEAFGTADVEHVLAEQAFCPVYEPTVIVEPHLRRQRLQQKRRAHQKLSNVAVTQGSAGTMSGVMNCPAINSRLPSAHDRDMGSLVADANFREVCTLPHDQDSVRTQQDENEYTSWLLHPSGPAEKYSSGGADAQSMSCQPSERVRLTPQHQAPLWSIRFLDQHHKYTCCLLHHKRMLLPPGWRTSPAHL